MNRGIALAGNLLVDYVKVIDTYPEKGMLCNVSRISRCIGGCAANTAASLAILDPTVPVRCAGMVGTDENGEYILQFLKNLGVNIAGIHKTSHAPTSFTDVMTVNLTGERTFFHGRGANALFGPEHLDFSAPYADIFHLGYALLLDRFDTPDKEFGTVMARTLHLAKLAGMKTSMDIVSENSARYTSIVVPALRHCDWVFANEIEAGYVTGITPRNGHGCICADNMRHICEKILKCGVGELAVVHAPEGGWCIDKSGTIIFEPALCLPEGYIQGTVGAGDAFCAGMLYALYHGQSVRDALRLANGTAACCLSSGDSVSGMKPLAEIQNLIRQFGSASTDTNAS